MSTEADTEETGSVVSVPPTVPPELVRDYNGYAPISVAENIADLADRRERCPISYSTEHGGFWLITRYDDIAEVQKRKDVFSSYPASFEGAGQLGQTSRLIPVELDGAQHRAYRHLLNPLFNKSMAVSLESDMRMLANQLIDAIIDKGTCEFVSEFAGPLPGTIFLRMMGWPMDDAATFQKWADVILHGLPGATAEDNLAARIEAGTALRDYMAAIVEDRRANPTDDLTTVLVQADLGGNGPIPESELYDLIQLLLMAGLDTVQSALAQSFHFFAGDPTFRHEMMREDLMPVAVEEMLRWIAPAQVWRTATVPVEVCGVKLQPGDRVHTPAAAANRDPKYYSSPDQPRLDRGAEIQPHLTFSAGPHRCLGSHIARLEMQVAFEEWHRRIPDYTLAPGEPVTEHLSTVWGVDRLVLQW